MFVGARGFAHDIGHASRAPASDGNALFSIDKRFHNFLSNEKISFKKIARKLRFCHEKIGDRSGVNS
jgi:hypothetical protein